MVNHINNNPAKTLTSDILVIGSGLAGLLLAVELAKAGATVTLVSKGLLGESNTASAQGGVAVVMPGSCTDSTTAHLKDTIAAGAGLTDETVARQIIKEGAVLVRRLSELGIDFDVDASGRLESALEGGHSHPRVVHSKDVTGKAISLGLVKASREHPNIQVLEHTTAVELLTVDNCCQGAMVLVNHECRSIWARQVVLATGGIGQVFERTTNPDIATADGIALAWRAGARLVDLEFVQFHPTALCQPGAPAFLISEAVRGAGAHLLDKHGRRFANRFHSDAELATRDIVARGIDTIMCEQGIPSVWLDLRPIGTGTILARFPNIVAKCREFGIDPLEEPVPVAPAAHYFMGGIWTDENGETTIPGLYAIGECASTGLHGANRLASNSLLEAGVMAMRVATNIQDSKPQPLARRKDYRQTPLTIPSDLPSLRKLMYTKAGLQRDELGLREALSAISINGIPAQPASRLAVEGASIYLLSELIVRAAIERRESRGAHFRTDYPFVDNLCFRKRLYMSKNRCGWLDVPVFDAVKQPVPALIA